MQHFTETSPLISGVSLFRQHWLPQQTVSSRAGIRAVIVLAHGYGEHSTRYTHLAAFLTERGFAVHTLDHRGHGRSANGATGYDTGYFASFSDLVADYRTETEAATATYAESHPALPLFLLGHSMGGLIVLNMLINQGYTLPNLRGAITNGALLDAGVGMPALALSLISLLGKVAPHLPLVSIAPETVARDPGVVQAYIADPLNSHVRVPVRVVAEFISAVKTVRAHANKITLPILMMHGTGDQLVKPEGTQTVFGRVQSRDKTLKLWDGLGHECFNEPQRQAVMETVAAWIEARLA